MRLDRRRRASLLRQQVAAKPSARNRFVRLLARSHARMFRVVRALRSARNTCRSSAPAVRHVTPTSDMCAASTCTPLHTLVGSAGCSRGRRRRQPARAELNKTSIVCCTLTRKAVQARLVCIHSAKRPKGQAGESFAASHNLRSRQPARATQCSDRHRKKSARNS